MKRMSLFFALSLLLFQTYAFAQDTIRSPIRYIEQIYPHNNGLNFALSGTKFNTNSSCTNRFIIRTDERNYETKAAGLLTAYGMGSPIEVFYDNISTNCWVRVDRFVAH